MCTSCGLPLRVQHGFGEHWLSHRVASSEAGAVKREDRSDLRGAPCDFVPIFCGYGPRHAVYPLVGSIYLLGLISIIDCLFKTEALQQSPLVAMSAAEVLRKRPSLRLF